MHNVWALFKDDLRRLGSNVVTIITVLGLVALPSIFSWYNILACWSVFDNTGNLTVAVANSDEGYVSDLVPLKVNIGDEITSALRANDQLDWVFTDEDDAIDGARSGRYYAAVVIPASFSRDMMSFYSSDVEHAQITYYSNQKKSAIAPKVTDQGADQVSAQVNKVFAETISQITLSLASALLDYADGADATGRLGDLADHVSRLGAQMGDASEALQAYSAALASSQKLVQNAGTLAAQAQQAAAGIVDKAKSTQGTSDEVAGALESASASLSTALSDAAGAYSAAADSLSAAYDEANASAGRASALLREQAAVASQVGDSSKAKALTDAADSIDAANAETQASRAELQKLAEQARTDASSAKAAYDADLKPKLDQLSQRASEAAQTVKSTADLLDGAGADMADSADSLAAQIGSARTKVDSAASALDESATTLTTLGNDLTAALASGDTQALRAIVGSDPAQLAAVVAAPVEMERHAVYPVDNFGSAMTPLYTTLALWIGALVLMVTFSPNPSRRTLARLNNPTQRQVYLGRFGIVAVISLMQSTTLSLGNLLFLGVQAVHPLLYLLCFWVSGLVFAFIIYTLVSLFANLGKALSVVLLIVQVAGGGGSFPLQLLPSFFQSISPYLPIAHAVSAMRAAMFGLYNGDFWIELGILLLFAIPMGVLGIALRAPLGKIVPKFVERVEKSKLM